MMTSQFLILVAITWIASSVGTATGFGTSTIMVPVLLLFYPLPVTLLFVGIIHLCGDIWKIVLFKKGVNWKLVLGFGIPGIIASYVGASISLNASPVVLKRFLGAFLLLYVIFLFVKRQWELPRTNRMAVVGGSLSGFFAGVFGVGGAVRGAFLSAFNLPKEIYIFTSGIIALFIDSTRILKYLSGGILLEQGMAYSLIGCIPVSFLGAYLAKMALNKVPQVSFRLLIAGFLGLVALKFLVFPPE